MRINVCKCGMAELYHTVGCYGNPYPDMYEYDKTIETNLSKEQFEEIFNRLEGEEGCDFKDDGTWKCAGGMNKDFVSNIMRNMNINQDEINKAIIIFDLFGGHCDCEVLFNAEEKIMDSFTYKNDARTRQELMIASCNSMRENRDKLIEEMKENINKLKELREEKNEQNKSNTQ